MYGVEYWLMTTKKERKRILTEEIKLLIRIARKTRMDTIRNETFRVNLLLNKIDTH